jgi:hypothetical protein
VFGVVHEEDGARLMVREKQIIPMFQTKRSGEEEEKRLRTSNARTTNRLAWTTHKTYGMGASGRLC